MDAIMSGVPAEPCYGTYRPFYFTDYVPHGHHGHGSHNHGSHHHNSHNEKPSQHNKEGNTEKQIIDDGKYLPEISTA